jgi:hypothetical protein
MDSSAVPLCFILSPLELSFLFECNWRVGGVFGISRCEFSLLSLILTSPSKGQSGYYLALSGRTYHRMLPTDRPNHAGHWFIYDSSAIDRTASSLSIPPSFVSSVSSDLLKHNPLYSAYQSFARFLPHDSSAYIELSDTGPASEIAAIYHTGDVPDPGPRSVYVQRLGSLTPTRVNILNALYEPLQYPLFYTHGTKGWGVDTARTSKFSQIQYYKARLLTEPRFHDFTRLVCEWLCDMYSRVEDERLDFIRSAKKRQIADFAETVEGDEDEDGFSLPASFTGSPKYYSNHTADALALCRCVGKPDLMITATTNPDWPELKAALQGKAATECPAITVRCFRVCLSPDVSTSAHHSIRLGSDYC